MHRSRFVLPLALVALIGSFFTLITVPPVTLASSGCTSAATRPRSPLLAQVVAQACDDASQPDAAPSAGVAADYPLYLPLALAPSRSQPPVDSSLAGRWIWVKDSDGTVPAPGAECTLFFVADGTVDLDCNAPDAAFDDYGTFSVVGATASGGTITLALPGVPISVAAQPYSRAGERLTLPFVLINDAEGTSEWVKQAPVPADSPDFAAVAFDAYEQAIARGADDATAAEAAAAALRNRSFPLELSTAGTGTAAMQAAPLTSVTLNAQKTLLRIKRENGRVYYVLLKSTQPKDAAIRDQFRSQPPKARLSPGFFANDPRTQLYMQPSSGPNDPLNHKAALLFAFHTQKVFAPRGGYFSFRNEGEDPEVLRKQLLRAGYQGTSITLKLDGAVTPKVVMDVLLQNPGVFYISTHGGAYTNDAGADDYLMLLGQKLEPKAGETFDQALDRTRTELGIPSYLWPGVVAVPMRVERIPEKHQQFLALTGDFFKALRANNAGWNMQRSLVYVDACESTTNTSLVQHMRAAAFIGWREPSDAFSAARYSQHFFRNAVRKTHSAREVWDETWRVLMTRQSIYEEDVGLDDADYYKRVKLVEENRIYDAYGADGKRYKRLGDQLYQNTQPDVVFWLVWLGRWNQNPDTASNNLQSCYDQYWSKGQAGGLGSPMCNAGTLGSHLPTANEVKEARQLINGSPTPILGGRWTLADKLPYANPFSGPMD